MSTDLPRIGQAIRAVLNDLYLLPVAYGRSDVVSKTRGWCHQGTHDEAGAYIDARCAEAAVRASHQNCCATCRTPLDIPGRSWTRNCGGDCLACMADAGDPECVAAMGQAAILPPGWRAVPEVPTEAMLDAGSRAQTVSGEPVGYEGASNAWTAMIEATPTPPATENPHA